MAPGKGPARGTSKVIYLGQKHRHQGQGSDAQWLPSDSSVQNTNKMVYICWICFLKCKVGVPNGKAWSSQGTVSSFLLNGTALSSFEVFALPQSVEL